MANFFQEIREGFENDEISWEEGRKGKRVWVGLLQFASSLMSPQSFQPSHCSDLAMHMPVSQANLSGQAAHVTEKEKKKTEQER